MSDIVLQSGEPDTTPPEPETATRPDTLEVGQWYWVTSTRRNRDGEDESYKWFGCLTYMGSNYARIDQVRAGNESSHVRVHFDEFFDCCAWVPNAQSVIDIHLKRSRGRLDDLLKTMAQLTASLAIAPQRELHAAGTETTALAVSLSEKSYADYKGALVKAKKDELPAIFKEIEAEHAEMAKWMAAPLLPLKAQSRGLDRMIAAVDARIFNVELYAGLCEQIAQCRDGAPAEMAEPLTMIQRRHYMDEECLARYEFGGMRFDDIVDFDAWISRDTNMMRLLPFARCMVAFRVRRKHFERRIEGWSDYIQFMWERDQDQRTYLYIRNGEQLFRMSTGIDFGSQLFPDIDRETLGGSVKLWAVYDRHESKISSLITDHDHSERVRAWDERVSANERARVEFNIRRAAMTEDERDNASSWFSGDHDLIFDEPRYAPFDKSSVHFDDIAKFRQDQIDAHNRIALVVQGLLDRSPVLHPHPPWQIWTSEGYEQAIRLVFDDDRALTPGAAPDFEAYRACLSRLIRVGTHTIGQDVLWAAEERRKESERRARHGGRWEDRKVGDWWRPCGNPGPGYIGEVKARRGKSCSFEWIRPSGKRKRVPLVHRPGWERFQEYAIQAKFIAEQSALFNVTDYTPGDFRRFFDDPRTRANYLQWAPFMLAAEEWHAGNRKGVPDMRDEEEKSKPVPDPEPDPYDVDEDSEDDEADE